MYVCEKIGSRRLVWKRHWMGTTTSGSVRLFIILYCVSFRGYKPSYSTRVCSCSIRRDDDPFCIFVSFYFLWFFSPYLFSHIVIFISMLFSFLSRPAGIRTMSLVSLGSCLFTITSTFAFLDGPMSWDGSRVAAAIPSGVGFLGAGLIFKKEQHNSDGSDPTPMVHGLTTAASLWLSAAVGIACGGELYFAASFGTATMMLLLRFGPRGDESKHDDSDDEEEELERKMSDAAGGGASFQSGHETKSLLSLSPSRRAKEKKLRQRANLASIV